MRTRRSRFAVGLALIVAACGLDLQGQGPAAPEPDGAAPELDSSLPEAAAPDGALPDSPGEASDAGDAAIPPKTTVVASAGTIATATGLSQQTHFIYATGSARWWLFFIDSTDLSLLKTASSSDFNTWTPGAALSLPQPHGSDGRAFSVDYASVGGQDVVHLTFSHRVSSSDRRRYHTRATISAATVTFETPNEINSTIATGPLDPDGTVTLIARDHRVIDGSGWITSGGTGNAMVWPSTNVDLGTSWNAGFGAVQQVAYVSYVVNARALVSLDGGQLLSLWEAGDVEPDPTNVRFSRWGGTAWTAGTPVFTAATQSANDWAVWRVSDTDVHIVRRISTGAYEHRRYNGATWDVGGAIPVENGLVGAGLVLLPTAQGIALVTIAADAASSVRQTRWDGSVWSAWSTVEGAPAVRSYISGYGALAAGKLAVIWTQTSGASFDIVAAPVSP